MDVNIVMRAQSLFGAALTAYMTGEYETVTVRAWAQGISQPTQEQQSKLELAVEVAEVLSKHGELLMLQSWFQALNYDLGEVSPARAIREGMFSRGQLIRAADNSLFSEVQ